MSDMSARLVAHIGQQVARAEAAEAEVEGLLKRAEQAEAVIARVRELCDRIWDDARYAHKYGFLEVVREVRYALEGDNDE